MTTDITDESATGTCNGKAECWGIRAGPGETKAPSLRYDRKQSITLKYFLTTTSKK